MNPLITSSIDPQFFSEKRFIYQEKPSICPKVPGQDPRERLKCLARAVNKNKRQVEKTEQKETLSKDEIPRMDKSMNVIFRLLLQPSFLDQSVLPHQRDAAEKAMKLAAEHYDKMEYTKKDGDIVIRIRKSKTNDFKIRIQGGVIKEIVMGKHVINKIGNPRDWKVEWKEMQTKLTEVGKVYPPRPGHKFPSHLLPHMNYFFYKLPRKYRDLLLLKQKMFPLDKEEKSVLTELEHALSKQRKHHLDKTGTDYFYVYRKIRGADKTPDYVVEFIYPRGHKKATTTKHKTFARFSFDGFLQKDAGGGKYEKSSSSFAAMYKKKHNIN